MRNLIIFNHIFKNAGSTVSWALQNSLGKCFNNYHQLIENGIDCVDALPSFLEDNEQLQAIEIHHFFYGMLSVADYKLHDILLLRSPSARMRSNYDFVRSKPEGQPLGPYAKRMNFSEFIDFLMHEWGRGHTENQQVRILAHDGTSKLGAKKTTDENLSTALTVVEQVAAIGLVERFDESMVLAEVALKPFFPALDLSYVKQNVTKKSQRSIAKDTEELFRERVGDHLYDEFHERNKMDYAVFDYANRQMDKRIQGVADFEGKLSDFYFRCRNKVKS